MTGQLTGIARNDILGLARVLRTVLERMCIVGQDRLEGAWPEQLHESILPIAFLRTVDSEIVKPWGWRLAR